jgi:hypothetical protein
VPFSPLVCLFCKPAAANSDGWLVLNRRDWEARAWRFGIKKGRRQRRGDFEKLPWGAPGRWRPPSAVGAVSCGGLTGSFGVSSLFDGVFLPTINYAFSCPKMLPNGAGRGKRPAVDALIVLLSCGTLTISLLNLQFHYSALWSCTIIHWARYPKCF